MLLVSLFHPELIRGGAQQICYELFEGLKERDEHDVTLLASTDTHYPALYKAGARITGFDGRKDEFLFLMQDYDYWWHKTSSPQVIDAFIDFLGLIRPDIVHFHHSSPSASICSRSPAGCCRRRASSSPSTNS